MYVHTISYGTCTHTHQANLRSIAFQRFRCIHAPHPSLPTFLCSLSAILRRIVHRLKCKGRKSKLVRWCQTSAIMRIDCILCEFFILLWVFFFCHFSFVHQTVASLHVNGVMESQGAVVARRAVVRAVKCHARSCNQKRACRCCASSSCKEDRQTSNCRAMGLITLFFSSLYLLVTDFSFLSPSVCPVKPEAFSDHGSGGRGQRKMAASGKHREKKKKKKKS